MKTRILIFSIIILFFANSNIYSINEISTSRRSIEVSTKGRYQTGNIKSLPIENISLLSLLMLDSYDFEFTFEGIQDINIKVTVINEDTGDIIYSNGINVVGNTVTVPLGNLENYNTYSLTVTYNNIIWEGNFQIEDENL